MLHSELEKIQISKVFENKSGYTPETTEYVMYQFQVTHGEANILVFGTWITI